MKQFMPYYEADGAGTGVPSEPAAGELSLMDDSDWESSQTTDENPESVEGEPPEETKETIPDVKPEDVKPPETPKTYRLKHNKEEVELTEAQLMEAASKGLDYERIRGDRDSMKPTLEMLDQYAGMAGTSREQFVKDLGATIRESMIANRVSQLVGEDGTLMSPEAAQTIAGLEYDNMMLKGTAKQHETAEAQATADREAFEARVKQDIENFKAVYPDVDVLPEEVEAEVRKGVPPLVAYTKYDRAEMSKKLSIAEQNNKNAVNSPGPARSTEPEQKKDDFLEGFNGG